MEQALKERLVGATVLVILAVIFIPMLLGEKPEISNDITKTNIPPKPEGKFSSRIIPLQEKSATDEVDLSDQTELRTSKNEMITEVPDTVTREADREPDERATSKDEIPRAVADKEIITERVGLRAWVVQLGSFSSEDNAEALNKKLRDAGFPAFVEPLKQKNTITYRVRVGPELKRSDAQSIRDQLKKSLKLDGIVVSYP